jgi:hypothetical protein
VLKKHSQIPYLSGYLHKILIIKLLTLYQTHIILMHAFAFRKQYWPAIFLAFVFSSNSMWERIIVLLYSLWSLIMAVLGEPQRRLSHNQRDFFHIYYTEHTSSSDNTSELWLGRAWFESWSGYQPSWQRFLVAFLMSPSKYYYSVMFFEGL